MGLLEARRVRRTRFSAEMAAQTALAVKALVVQEQINAELRALRDDLLAQSRSVKAITASTRSKQKRA